jgi:pyruvate dehydrogenase phosphatase
LVGYLTNHYLFVANAGDCRALLVAKGTAEDGSTKWLISDLATPHTADTEAERLHKQFPNDSDIVKNGMVKGLLKPSRGIGIVAMKHPQFTEMITQYTDVSKDQWKPPYITPAPDVTLTSLHPDDKYCIIATHVSFLPVFFQFSIKLIS